MTFYFLLYISVLQDAFSFLQCFWWNLYAELRINLLRMDNKKKSKNYDFVVPLLSGVVEPTRVGWQRVNLITFCMILPEESDAGYVGENVLSLNYLSE